jgi:hypothetical protein
MPYDRAEIRRMTSEAIEAQTRDEDWLTRERRIAVEREHKLARASSEAEHRFEALLARTRAIGCDDGRGVCLFCGVVLGVDAEQNFTHPDNDCLGPPRTCDICGMPYTVDTRGGRRTYVPACSAYEHERAAARRNEIAIERVRPSVLDRPRRVRRDIDDVD